MNNIIETKKETQIWIAMLIGNLLPLYGVFFQGWDVFSVFFIYWFETVVIGVFMVSKILIRPLLDKNPLGLLGGFFNAGFFTVHYGMFCFAHFSILLALFYEGSLDTSIVDDSVLSAYGFVKTLAGGSGLYWAVIGIIAAELIRSIFALKDRERKSGRKISSRDALGEDIRGPYGRIIILHISLIVGGFLVQSMGSQIWGLALLVGLKMLFDILKFKEPEEKPVIS